MSDDLRAAAIKLDSTIDPAAWDCANRLRQHAGAITEQESELALREAEEQSAAIRAGE